MIVLFYASISEIVMYYYDDKMTLQTCWIVKRQYATIGLIYKQLTTIHFGAQLLIIIQDNFVKRF